jgi:GGDEF domain-containing protein
MSFIGSSMSGAGLAALPIPVELAERGVRRTVRRASLSLNSVEDLATAAERLRLAVAEAAIPHPRNEPTKVVTSSLGGVLLTPADLTMSDDEWFAKADAALCRAKANGRNRAELAA